jgi:DNA-binding GntR family transcriptional regulator
MVRTGAEAREWAEQALRAAMVRGDVVPGQRLIEEELSERFGVTRSSLRQAIDTLVSDGLVERITNRGARVRRLSIAEAVEITECRAVLEGLIARKAAEHATDSSLSDLASHIDSMRDCLTVGDVVKYSDLIRGLYAAIHHAAQHPSASALVDRLQAQLVRQQFRLSLRPGRPQRSMQELTDVVEAITARRADDAERLMRTHLQEVADALQVDID